MTLQKVSTQTFFKNPLLWIIFVLYAVILGFTITHHELWGDEIHSWNIVKASNSIGDLIANSRYEGHPPVWYVILWSISRFTHNVQYIQAAHFFIASLSVFLLLFFSKIPVTTKALIPFGYFFLFEYAVLSRNYAIGILAAFIICIILQRHFKYRSVVYYIFLFILANTHLIALILACSLHFYFLLQQFEQRKKRSIIALHIFIGFITILPAVYFIFPPSDSSLGSQFFLSNWSMSHITALIQLPLRSFMPIPAWWNYHFWNTQFLLELQSTNHFVRIISAIAVLAVLLMLYFILRKNKKSLLLFSCNLLLSFIVSLVFSLTAARYSGFIFIGFIVSYWLYCAETETTGNKKMLVNMLLIIQLAAGIFATIKDIQLPFSNGYKVKELLAEVPPNKKIVTDYWTLNPLEAFTDKPFYCLELYKEKSFLQWNNELSAKTKAPDLYSNGVKYLFSKEDINEVYMITIHSLQSIAQIDPALSKSYRLKLIDKREGAIEKGGNLYLYEIKGN